MVKFYIVLMQSSCHFHSSFFSQ